MPLDALPAFARQTSRAEPSRRSDRTFWSGLCDGLNAAGLALTGGLQMPHRRRGDLAIDVARVGTYFEASRQR